MFRVFIKRATESVAAYEMARIEQIGSIFYSVKSRDEHNPPHFHFEKKQGKRARLGRILFKEAKYYFSKSMSATIDNSEAEALYNCLISKVPGDRFGRTYWERAVDDWNALPNVEKISLEEFPAPPDYRQINKIDITV